MAAMCGGWLTLAVAHACPTMSVCWFMWRPSVACPSGIVVTVPETPTKKCSPACCNQAITADPEFTLAHALLGLMHMLSTTYSTAHPAVVTSLQTVDDLLAQGTVGRVPVAPTDTDTDTACASQAKRHRLSGATLWPSRPGAVATCGWQQRL